MAMTLYETTLAANNIIRFEFREPNIVKPPIRDATAAEMQNGGVFERFTILSVSTGNPATLTADRNVPATGTYVRFCGAQGRPDINTTGVLAAVSGATFQLTINNGSTSVPYNGAHGPAYTANSATMVRLSTGTGSSRKYILGGNLDRVKDCDYFPGPRGDRSTSGGAWDMSGYTIAGKTITAIGFETNPYEVGSVAYGSDTNDMRYGPVFSFFVYLTISTTFSNGTYAVTFPSGLGIAPQNIVINDKVTRCCSIGVNQNGHKADDESKVATLCQYLPQGANQGSMRFGTDYSISSFKIIDSAGTEVWDSGAAPVLRLAHTTVENSGSTDSISQDPHKYGADIASVTPGNPTRITTVQPHGLTTGDYCSVLYARGVHSGVEKLYSLGGPSGIGPTATRIDDYTIDINRDTTGATAWASGGKVTKHYTVNYAGVHTYEMDFSAATLSNGTYYLYIPGFGVSDPIYIDDAAWARAAQANLKALYNTSMGMTVDDRFGAPAHGPSAKVGSQNVTQILYSPIPHMFWKEQGQGRLTVTASPRFLDGTASVELYGGYPDAGDHDRIFDFSHIVELVHMLGPKALLPLNARYSNHNFPDSKTNIGGVYTRKLFSDELDAAIWYLDMARRTQAVDGGIISAIQYNNGLSNFGERIAPQPHWDVNYNWLALAPDHLASIQYAYAASLLAWHLKEMGHTELSNTWVASAQLAISFYDTVIAGTHPADFYTAAKALYTEQPVSLVAPASSLTFVTSPDGYLPLTNVDGVQVVASGFTGGFAVMNGVTYCLRQSGTNIVVYDSTNTTAVNASGYGAYTKDTGVFTYTTAAWRSIHDASTVSIQGFTTAQLNKYKAAASGILYNLTGTASYKTFHDANYNLGDCWQWGTYIYTLAAGADPAIATAMYSSLTSTCNTFLFNKGGINDRSFTYFRQNSTMADYGSSTQAIYEYCASAMISHKKAYNDRRASPYFDTHAQARANSGVKKYVKHLQDAYGFLLGLNPPKLCLVMGYGQRNPAKVLNINADATGTGPPTGVVPYWGTAFAVRYQFNDNTYYWPGSPLNDQGSFTAGGPVDTSVQLIPHRFCRPRLMSFIPIPFLVEVTEYNLAKHYYLNGIASYLSSWAGDCVQSDGKKRLIARAA